MADALTDRLAVAANPRQAALVLVVDGLRDDGRHFVLSREENERAARYRQAEVALAYRLQHHLLRQLLGSWCGLDPEMLKFSRGPHGKPRLDGCPLHFNLSRSGTALAFYFGPQTGGIDLECERPSHGLQEVVAHHFHPNEQDLASSDRGFFLLWTRKEAVLKLIGCGLVDDLARIDCSRLQAHYRGQNAFLLSWPVDRKIISLALPERPAAPVHWLTLDYATGRLTSAHHSLDEAA